MKNELFLNPDYLKWLSTTEKCGEDGWYPTPEIITGTLLPEYYRTKAKPKTDDRDKKLQAILCFCQWVCTTADDGLDEEVRELLQSFLGQQPRQ